MKYVLRSRFGLSSIVLQLQRKYAYSLSTLSHKAQPPTSLSFFGSDKRISSWQNKKKVPQGVSLLQFQYNLHASVRREINR